MIFLCGCVSMFACMSGQLLPYMFGNVVRDKRDLASRANAGNVSIIRHAHSTQ